MSRSRRLALAATLLVVAAAAVDLRVAGRADRLVLRAGTRPGPAIGSRLFQGARVERGVWQREIRCAPEWGGGQPLVIMVEARRKEPRAASPDEAKVADALLAGMNKGPQLLFSKEVGNAFHPLVQQALPPGWEAGRPALAAPSPDLVRGALAALRTSPPVSHVVWLGLDGADWRVIDPLIAAGRLPNLGRLKRTGVHGPLLSAPPMLSPLLWTTMVTGKSPEEHGILDFMSTDPASGAIQPATSTQRTAPALWNIFTAAGLRSDWIGFWATFPAEPVAGRMVSDRLAFSLYSVPDAQGKGVCHPRELLPELQSLKGDPAHPDPALWRALLPDGPAPGDDRGESGPKKTLFYEDPVAHLRETLAATQTYFDVAHRFLEEDRAPFLGLYIEGTDEVAHRFMHAAPPRLPWVDTAFQKAYRQVVTEYYAWVDGRIGDLMEAAGDDTLFIVVSDHGFKNGTERPESDPGDFQGTAADWHDRMGIYLVSGPGVSPGEGGPASLTQVFPTLLAAAGLPVPEGFRALPGTPGPQAASVGSLDLVDVTRERPADVALSDEESVALLEKLKALGYVGGGALAPESGPASAGVRATPQSDYNRGVVLFAHGRLEEAKAAFERASQGRDDAYAAYYLGEIARRRNLPNEAARHYGKIAAQGARMLPSVYLPLVESLLQADKRADAERLARETPSIEGRPAPSLRLAAQAYLAERDGRLDQAAALYRDALREDPSLDAALGGLFRVLRMQQSPSGFRPDLARALEAGRPARLLILAGQLALDEQDAASARAFFQEALDKAPDALGALNGLARERILAGDAAGAARHVELALGLHPGDLETRKSLAALEILRGNPETARELYLTLAKDAPDDPAVLYPLAVLELKAGDEAAARKHLQVSREHEVPGGPSATLLEALGRKERAGP